MCGIAGIVDFNSAQPDESVLRRMLGLIGHRGPDAFGIYLGDHAGLAHARLSIIDLIGGDQPIHNEDWTVWVVYNGEIFNYPELREDLEAKGHRFYTRTDTEVLAHLYEDCGPDLFKDLNGQFAFAIWDKTRKSLLIGRDRLGIRPLFYSFTGTRLVFGSEVKAIFADPKVPRAIAPKTLADIFTCWAPLEGDTAFQNVRQLKAGHYAVFSREGMKTSPYWCLSFADSDCANRPVEEAAEELKELLLDAVRIRLRADVAVGAYLSGGLDSTYITAMVKRSFNNKLRTFSVSFEDNRFDEASFQAKAVAALDTDHSSICCTEKGIGEIFPKVVWHSEVPLMRTAPAPLHVLSKLVRENSFKVVLTGEGADEIFAGYGIFKEDRVRRFWARQPESVVRPRLFEKLYPDIFSGIDARHQTFLINFFRRGLTEVNSPVYSHLIRWANTSRLHSFFSQETQDAIQALQPFSERFSATLPGEFMEWNPLARAQYIEVSIFLSNYLLSSQGDRMAMANAVEGRYPFLDHRVVEFACKLQPRYRMHGLKDKFILRRSAANLIAPELAQRPKQPYRAPVSRCFLGNGSNEDLAMDLLSTRSISRAGYFAPSKVVGLVEKCRKQEGALLSERENMAVVGILSTQLLHDMFISGFPFSAQNDPKDVTIYREIN